MQTKLHDANKGAEDATTTAGNTKRQHVVAAGAYADLQTKSKAEIAYYKLWKPHFEEFPSGNAVTDKFLEKMVGLDAFSQLMEPAAYKDKYEVITKIQRIDLVFVGEYAKHFNWLAKIENDISTARVTNCAVSKPSGDQEIRMELTIEVPVLEGPEPNVNAAVAAR